MLSSSVTYRHLNSARWTYLACSLLSPYHVHFDCKCKCRKFKSKLPDINLWMKTLEICNMYGSADWTSTDLSQPLNFSAGHAKYDCTCSVYRPQNVYRHNTEPNAVQIGIKSLWSKEPVNFSVIGPKGLTLWKVSDLCQVLVTLYTDTAGQESSEEEWKRHSNPTRYRTAKSG